MVNEDHDALVSLIFVTTLSIGSSFTNNGAYNILLLHR